MRLLLLAPHPDDELLGCAGLLHQLVQSGKASQIKIIIATDGAAGGDPAQRRREALAGLAALGLPDSCAEFWAYPDGKLPLGRSLRQRYQAAINDWRPTHVALPAPSEAHPDHRRLSRGLLSALQGRWQGELLFYETTTPLPQANHHIAIDLDAKLAALTCHVSQQAHYDYLAHTRGLAALRGAAIGATAAEAFLNYAWDGSPQNFFEQRPLVSIIIRADDHSFLRLALTSLASQSYDQLEAIVIWHGDDPIPDDDLAPTVDTTILRGPGPRAANLNAGLDAAQGRYLAFLDQDDIFYPDHLATLLTELQADPNLDIAYGNCRLVSCHREGPENEHTVVDCELDLLGQDFRSGRLLIGNHIPLHSFLCSARLARRLRFDESLDAYEDWDFLVRADLAGCIFQHIGATICEYRLYPPTDVLPTAESLAAAHRRKGFTDWRQKVESKHLSLLGATAYGQLLALAGQLEDERNQAQRALQSVSAQYHQAQNQIRVLQADASTLSGWADLLAPDHPGGNPISRLAGQAFKDGPLLSIVLPVCDPAPDFLREALHTIEQQSYPHWQLCLSDDASTPPQILALLEKLAQRASTDQRLRLCRRPQRGGIVAATQDAVTLASGDWLVFVDHDDRLAPDALLEIAATIRRKPELTAIYTDSRMIDRNGVVLHDYLKSQWAPETLLHLNYINHLSAVRREAYRTAGGIGAGSDNSQDWQLWLRLSHQPDFAVAHIKKPLYDWRANENSVAYNSAAKPTIVDSAIRVVSHHLQHSGLDNVATQPTNDGPGLFHQWPARLEPLTAIIPTHNNPTDLARLLSSLAASDYPQLQVCLIANRVSDSATLALLEAAAIRPGWRVLRDDRPFNWAALNNTAAYGCDTPWLLFLNDDVELPVADNLRQLARYLTLDPAIGAVGARLDYGPEQGGGLQHDGVVTDPQWVARNIDEACRHDYLPGVPRNVSAVTGACLLTPRAAFERCSGFDERLAVSYNDIDYCLHLRRLGYRIMQASDVALIHRESRTRGTIDNDFKRQQWEAEARFMRDKWQGFLTENYALRYLHHYAGTRIISLPDN